MTSRLKRQKSELFVRWDKKEEDLMFYYPSSPDGHLLQGVLCGKQCSPDFRHQSGRGYTWENSLVEELVKRGYDITTLKFSVKRKKQNA